MSPGNFEVVCKIIDPKIQKMDANIPVKTNLVITLRRPQQLLT